MRESHPSHIHERHYRKSILSKKSVDPPAKKKKFISLPSEPRYLLGDKSLKITRSLEFLKNENTFPPREIARRKKKKKIRTLD